jgi:hypothetical protein
MDGVANSGYSLAVEGDQKGRGSEQPEPCCLWCGWPYRQRATGGSDQKFCRSACRNAFWSAARKWVWRAVEAGLLSPSTIRNLSMHGRS